MKNAKKEFDPYKYCTDEFNYIYAKLRVELGNSNVLVKLRHDNDQLVDDDWKSDLQKHIERKHEELMSGLGGKTPSNIFGWCCSLKDYLDQYGHWYWDASEAFFMNVCSSSLADYLTEDEVENIMAKLNSRLVEHLRGLKRDIEQSTKDIEVLAMQKNQSLNQLATLTAGIENIKKEQTALKNEIRQLEKEFKKKQEGFEKELLKKYNEQETKFKESIDTIINEKKKQEKELAHLVQRSKIASFIDSLFWRR